MQKLKPVAIKNEFSKLKLFKGRTPNTKGEDAKEAFALLSEYRDGGVYIAHYSGNSEWERHINGDEFIQMVEGETTLFVLSNCVETPNKLSQGEIFVIPKGLWHRFESPAPVKILTITPQPTEHSIKTPCG